MSSHTHAYQYKPTSSFCQEIINFQSGLKDINYTVYVLDMRGVKFNVEAFVNYIDRLRASGVKVKDIARRYAEIKGVDPEAAYQYLHSIYKRRRQPPTDLPTINALAQALGVNTSDLLVETVNRENRAIVLAREGVVYACVKRKIPILSEAFAGDFSRMSEDKLLEESLFVEEMFVERNKATHKLVGFLVQGDSMYPRLIEGDLVVVDVNLEPKVGDIVAVKIKGRPVLLKILKKKPESTKDTWVFRSWDPNRYPDIEVPASEVEAIAPEVFTKHGALLKRNGIL